MRNERFFQEIRYYLLGSAFLALILPFLKFSYSLKVEAELVNNEMDNLFVNPTCISADPVLSTGISIADILLFIYLAVATVLLIRSIVKIVQLKRLIRAGEHKVVDKQKVILLAQSIPAFTFFGYIVMNREEFNDKSLNNIFAHEKVHAQQKHWIDLLFVELLTIVFWFNPFVWLYQVAVKQTHELLADDGVIARGFNIGQYQAILMNQIMGTEVLGLANNFNYSITKKRMIMMSKEKSPQIRRYKLLIVIPVVLAVLLFNLQIVEVQAQQYRIDQKVKLNEENVFAIVDQMPEFPGGAEALQKFIAEAIKYPKVALEKGIRGRVFVTFVVNKEGDVVQGRVVRGVEASLDAEAVRALESMPRWTPGYEKGEAVNVSYTVPINFDFKDDVQIDESSSDKKGNNIQMDSIAPKFPGGFLELRKYLAKNVKYPLDAQKNGVEGNVLVTFVVTKLGAVDSVRVVKSVSPSLDEEAMRVIKTQSNWIPGNNGGKSANFTYTLPINFLLRDGSGLIVVGKFDEENEK